MKRSEEPIIVEVVFENSLESVWGAITEFEKMREWFFENIPRFKPEVGFEVEFDVDAGERSFLHQWKITKVTPKRLIEFNWKYGGYPGDSYVSFRLEQVNGSTKLTLTHTTTEDFPEDIPEFKRESGVAGWQYFIKDRLKEYLIKASRL
jgi:uncharacterized protein YndB with AHSA1/START domain